MQYSEKARTSDLHLTSAERGAPGQRLDQPHRERGEAGRREYVTGVLVYEAETLVQDVDLAVLLSKGIRVEDIPGR